MITFLLQQLQKACKVPAMILQGDPMLAFKLLPLESGHSIIDLRLFFLRPLQREWMEILRWNVIQGCT
jgi:hypothetical protein